MQHMQRRPRTVFMWSSMSFMARSRAILSTYSQPTGWLVRHSMVAISFTAWLLTTDCNSCTKCVMRPLFRASRHVTAARLTASDAAMLRLATRTRSAFASCTRAHVARSSAALHVYPCLLQDVKTQNTTVGPQNIVAVGQNCRVSRYCYRDERATKISARSGIKN